MKIGKQEIDAIELASQGNAILGIRDSGKTYTGTWLAEQFLTASIPFVAFDPIGVWRYLRVGKGGKPGFNVVVAGDGGDLPLTPETAPNIVRAAMQENIPLVIDLYSIHLSKTQWKQIMEQCVNLLLYENKNYGLRHVFIEEAAEFVPQRVRPDEGRVYAALEKLARMGRNASLGYTLINQRAEEVNKAVLELCDGLFLHRQKGRNSLTALSKWLDIADASNGREIIKSLPTLPQGECWYWAQGSSDPVLIKVPEKMTFHPDPKNPEKVKAGTLATADVSAFIERMNKSLAKQVKEKPVPANPKAIERAANKLAGKDEDGLYPEDKEIARLTSELNMERSQRVEAQRKLAEANRRLDAVKVQLAPQYETMKSLFSELEVQGNGAGPADAGAYALWLPKLQGGERRMLELLIEKKRMTRQQFLILLGVSGRSLTNYISTLHRARLISKEGEYIVLNEIEG